MLNKQIVFCNGIQDLGLRVAEDLANYIQNTINDRGICHMVFSGGRSIRPIIESLSKKNILWSALHMYPSDERCVPLQSDERNDRLMDNILLNKLLPLENLHRIPAELGPEEGALSYQIHLEEVPRFDIALLSVGEDGHIASLFPNAITLLSKDSVVAIKNSPKLPPERVSIGLSRLVQAREKWIVIRGVEKKSLVNQMLQEKIFPVTDIHPTQFFIDKACWENA